MAILLLEGKNLQTERLNTGKRCLLRDLNVMVNGELYSAPEGMVTDFSSIPWFGRWLVDWSRVDIAGVIHDRLYETGEVNRRHADNVWFEIAIAGNRAANRMQAYICWLALRVGGGFAWRRCRRQDGLRES